MTATSPNCNLSANDDAIQLYCTRTDDQRRTAPPASTNVNIGLEMPTTIIDYASRIPRRAEVREVLTLRQHLVNPTPTAQLKPARRLCESLDRITTPLTATSVKLVAFCIFAYLHIFAQVKLPSNL